MALDAQDRMEEEYRKAISNRHNLNEQEARFKARMKYAAEQGLLLFIKYALVLILAYLALTFGMNVVSGAQNGTTAILYLNQMIEKGYLPKAVNGQVPSKEMTNETSTVK